MLVQSGLLPPVDNDLQQVHAHRRLVSYSWRLVFRFRWDGRIGLEVLSIKGARRSLARQDIADVLEKIHSLHPILSAKAAIALWSYLWESLTLST